jgi:hypothetical protein
VLPVSFFFEPIRHVCEVSYHGNLLKADATDLIELFSGLF